MRYAPSWDYSELDVGIDGVELAMVGAGAGVCIVGLLLWAALFTNNKVFVYLYIGLTCILVVFEVGIAIMALVHGPQVADKIDDAWIKMYTSDPNQLHTYQKKHDCCGLWGYYNSSDYYYPCTADELYNNVTKGCCGIVEGCETVLSCLGKVQCQAIGSSAFCMVLLQLVTLIFPIFLMKHLGSE